VPFLLPLQGRARLGMVLQLAGVLLLLCVALLRTGPWVGWTLLAAALIAFGSRSSLPPLRRWLLAPRRLDLARLRALGDAGAVLGSLFTAALFPLLRSLAPQFALAGLLLLPAALLVGRPGWTTAGDHERATAADPGPVGDTLDLRCGLQGLLFGAMFALLPLWVRAISRGSCVDFGLVLSMYGLGRPLAPLLGALATARSPRLSQLLATGSYAAIALLLLGSRWWPGWVTVALFLPIGTLAAGSDAALADSLRWDGDPAARLQILERSGALGGLLGSLGMGVAAQTLGLGSARGLIVGGFLVAAFALPGRPPASGAGGTLPAPEAGAAGAGANKDGASPL